MAPEIMPAQITGNLAQLLGKQGVGQGPKMAQSWAFDETYGLARPLLIRVWSQAIQVFK
ncbi:MAG TPA: hypothetical protein VJV39_06700 [Dongiaceae bacterium]|nr:hypothetical protein [Dongiaceae bacterium]